VHLHCHSHYSLLDGASKVPDLVQRAKALGMSALAITDHGNLYGAVEFLREAKAADLKPIIGLEAYVAPGRRTERTGGGVSGQETAFHLTLLARTGEGVRNLMRLSSKAFLEGFYYKPRIDKEILQRHAEGLICLSGCASAEFSDLILHGKMAEAEQLCAWYQKVFGAENFYIEIQDNGVPIQRDCMEGALEIARRMGLPVVATSDAHYLTREDAQAHDILLCINTGKTVDDPNRMKFETDEFHVRSPEEMYAAMPGHDEALAMSVRIAELVEDHYKSLGLGKRQFPSFQPPEGKTPEQYLRELCEQGLRDRYGDEPPPAARERLEHELGIICRMGFASYFLIVWDFVRFAREHDIPSSARGSACGALVSYLLKLSHVDPIQYDLLFERFLDPNRSEAPDIDIDLCQERRYEVIEYVRRKYGAANVAQIGTFGTMKAKAALKDVGRALNIPLARVDLVTKLIPTRLNITLDEALQEEPQLKRMAEEDPEIARLIEYARRLEGTVRNVSTHAAGVVIADKPLDALVPLQKIPNKDKEKEVVSTQWEMVDIEKVGLLKMDFLGLRNLTSLQAAVRLINARHPENPIDLNRIPLDDEATYKLLQRGEAKGVFQLEGAGIRDLLVKMKPDRFTDLIAILALYRPGPLNGGMVDAYVNRKHGREVPTYEHPVMKEVLEETYGVMCYQEQVMRLLNRLGGIELSQAYACIKAISKKKADIIAQGRAQFIEGAIARGLAKETATRIFDLIEYFGGYGFNKSHSTAYALVLYQTAYLKAHHPTEFMAAVLSSEMDGAEREKFFVEHIEDCRRLGIEVLPPDINAGEVEFRPAGEGQIHFGLGAIKGVGTKAIEAILQARREGGPFTSLDDFFERVSTKEVGQGAAEILIKAGAFDCLGARRSQLLAVLPRAIQGGQARQEDRRRGQRSLFDAFNTGTATAVAEPAAATLSLPDIPELPDAELLAGEKKALGFYMSSHPLTRHADTLRAFCTHTVTDLESVPEKAEVTLGGMIGGLQIRNVQRSRSGLTRMAKLTFEDLTGSVPAMLWPEEFAKNEALIQDDAIVFVKGTLDRRRDPAELIINRVIPLARAAAELSRGVVVRLHKGLTPPEAIERLHRQLRNRPGHLDVFLEIVGLVGYRRAIYKAAPTLRIRHDERLIADLEAAVGAGNVRLLGPSGATARIEARPT
ncbi:MAG: DNA polymerase III subunit alpha, partial [Isosphaeraceae bacterium]|nr:DNA polymerase III subunit alpha [Isosphaeraceae bacterium]